MPYLGYYPNLIYNFVAIIGYTFMVLFFPYQFFTTKPLPCDPSSLPKYPPSKEFDAKLRDEEARRYACYLRASSISLLDTERK